MFKKYLLAVLVLIIIVGIPLLIYKAGALKREYKSEILSSLNNTKGIKSEILTQNDIKDLPPIVQKYLRYTNVLGKEKVYNFRSIAKGEFKTDPNKTYVKAESMQYNFIGNDKRVYFMKINMSGLPVVGLHIYKNAAATMRIRLAGLIQVANAKGEIMNKSETVTVFNDMCLLAPATLIDKRITWETINPLKVKATFNNNGIVISAILEFNEKGELINFTSNDRALTTSGEKYEFYTWSTPVRDYKDYHGVKLASYGEAHWSMPSGDYCYGKLYIKDVNYNLKYFY